MDTFRKLDAFPKTMDDFRVKTVSGAIVSIISVCLMTILFIGELQTFMRTETVDHLYVNTTRANMLQVGFDISFHEIPCKMLSLDAVDDAGASQKDSAVHNIYKHRLSPSGEQEGEAESHGLGDTLTSEESMEKMMQEHEDRTGIKFTPPPPALSADGCGNCYGAGVKGQCCNSCDDVKSAYAKSGWKFKAQGIAQCQRDAFMDNMRDEFSEDGGCQVYGTLELNKASGHFHIAPHKDVHKGGLKQGGLFSLLDLISFTFDQFNITHTVNYLAFGDQFPGVTSPLDNQMRVIEDTHGMYQYYVKVVPTKYKGKSSLIESNQYSVTEHMRHLSPGSGRGLPGLYFYYEVSPITAVFEERSAVGVFRFFTNCCAIMGGVFTVMGLVDAVIGGVVSWSLKLL